VHRGDWKLIPLFHGGEKGAHRFMLFNLSDDIGEKNNLVFIYRSRSSLSKSTGSRSSPAMASERGWSLTMRFRSRLMRASLAIGQAALRWIR
jgi:hypothetical protein